MSKPVFLRRVVLRNYKSIGLCDVQLGPLTYLVGVSRARMAGGTYGETIAQPAFSARFDLQQAFDGSRSFRKLCSEWNRQTLAP